jgi:hypothetical protein
MKRLSILHFWTVAVLIAIAATFAVAQAPTAGPLVTVGAGLGANAYTGAQNLPQGTISLPSLLWGTDTATGFYQSSANTVTFAQGGTNQESFSSNRFGFSKDIQVCFSSTNSSLVTCDLGIARNGAGQLAITTGSGGTAGALALTTINYTATLFASLGTPANGTFLYCSDCTVASTCAGSGTGALAKRLNGAWVCN